MHDPIEIFEDKAGEWRFRVRGANGEIVAQSESYTSSAHAGRGAEDLVEILLKVPGGVPVSDWSWWVGSDESVKAEGLYDLEECYSLQDAIEYGGTHVEAGDRFHIIEARTRQLGSDDEFQPFAAMRHHQVFDVGANGEPTLVEAVSVDAGPVS